MQSLKRTLVLIILGWLGAVSSPAFSLIPISATLAPKGYGTTTSFRVENETSNRVAFQITMVTREMDELGEETHVAASNLFTVFPPQGVIGAGQRQNVRVIWKGTPEPTNELAFRIIAEELPVSFDPETKDSHIKLLVRYLGTVYIRPKNAAPKLEILDLVQATNHSTATNRYELTLANNGGAHLGLKNCVLTLTDSHGQTMVLKADQLDQVEGQNILAHHRRRFAVTLPDNWREPKYHADLHVDE